MSKNRISLLQSLIWLLSAVVLLGATPQATTPIKVFTSIAPQSYFVRAVGGEAVTVEVLVPPGQSPATYEPAPQQMTRLAEADILFTTGVPFERRLLEKLAGGYENLKIVKTHQGIELRPIERHDHGEHEHEGMLDPHVWLDPSLAKIQAENICRALINAEPSQRLFFAGNLSRLLSELDSVAAAVNSILSPVKGRKIFVFHPAYGYLCDAFNLQQVAIETGGKQPSAKQLGNLLGQAKEDGVKVVFVQPQFSRRQAESVGKAIGAQVETLDPLSADYINNLLEMAGKIARALNSAGLSSVKITSP